MDQRDARASRRTVLAAGAATLCGGLLAACSDAGVGRGGGAVSTGVAPASPNGTTAAGDPPPEPRVVGTVAENLDTPWSIVFLPDGTALVSERDTGAVHRVKPDGGTDVLGVVPGVVHGGEGGLLGLEPSPGFGNDALLYAYFTADDGNRVSRFKVGATGLGREQPVLTGMPSAGNHNGGRIKFGPDGLLYVGTGDAGRREASQDPQSPSGKILRLDVAAGRDLPLRTPAPFVSLGHRNVQGIGWDPEGRMWSTEFGPDRDDEFNFIRDGGNYGWPEVTGAADDGRFVPAVHVWSSTAEASPSALAIAGGYAYAACLRGERLWQLPLPQSGSETGAGGALPGAREFLRGEYGRLREVVTVPRSAAGAAAGEAGKSTGGQLWVATNEGASSRILRLALAPAG